ncbi:MAG: hypothetical protein N0C81_15600 [Candidatus Thiodiazotropha lotti]|uniref:Uncharacterized protein n=1 Tax=Candidatus Thiodiazotropha lotti TaxID=2792787 RepID=A0A9E4MZG5_9GAMM|nr:hypothetical protein [Candidatus Thiodiazotropha lotti]MCG7937459.1 hypothetical protein [Candidatus Thiodiazotropha lotti]MCG8003990.1 hypothetical protein [Candidatus Thiodiazotropha lotti]MCG8009050.1 hypothetical protein [Candidatus Thiodiazotropha lotti]MCW4187611.1 hypothetical protein [Candidatus Thiodiazotropha lotti]
MSIDFKSSGAIHSIQKLNDNHQHNTEFTNISSVKNQLRFNNINKMDGNNQSIQTLTKTNNVNYSFSKCVTNLNLTKMHIDKLHLDSSNKVNKNKQKLYLHSQQTDHYYEETDNNYQNNDVFKEPLLTQVDIYHIDLINQLHSNIESSNSNYTDYVILILYQMINDTQLINKQLITGIPIVNGVPERSITEITIISDSGKLFKHNKTICLHRGRITYTNDWIALEEVERVNVDNTLFKFTVNYDNLILHGIALNKQSDHSLKLSDCTLYIADFSKIWI